MLRRMFALAAAVALAGCAAAPPPEAVYVEAAPCPPRPVRVIYVEPYRPAYRVAWVGHPRGHWRGPVATAPAYHRYSAHR